MNIEKKDKFIELRAEGNYFDKIAELLDVSKPTLIKQQREFESEISNLKFLRSQ